MTEVPDMVGKVVLLWDSAAFVAKFPARNL